MKHDFWYLVSGRLFSNIGDSLYSVAAMWLIFELTGNSVFTGIAGFLTMLPSGLQFLIGPYIDRADLKKVLVFSQLIQFVLIISIPLFYHYNFLNVYSLLFIMFSASCASAFAYPAQMSLLPRIVSKNSMTKANSLMALAYQGTDILFMAISGVLITITATHVVLFYNSFLFLVTSILFTMIRYKKLSEHEGPNPNEKIYRLIKNYYSELTEGFNYIKNSLIPQILLGSVIANFLIGAFIVSLPSYANDRGGVEFYGYYLAAFSAGSLVGSLLALLLKEVRIGRLTIVGFLFSGLVWLVSGLINNPIISVILLGLASIIMGITNVIFMTLIQNSVDEKILGRVISLIVSLTVVATPLGNLVGGFVSEWFGSMYAFIGAGVGLIYVSLYWLSNPNLRGISTASKSAHLVTGVKLKKEMN
nr:MFS transporter [Paenibacillus xylanexedens]